MNIQIIYQRRRFFLNNFILILGFTLCYNSYIYSYAHHGHQNMSEDALVYMETHGSIQQRWVTDYLKGKIGGRYASQAECSVIPYHAQNVPRSGITDARQCGTHGIFRVSNTLPDYFRDYFWTTEENSGILNSIVSFDWNVPALGIIKNNLSAGQHFINLLDGDRFQTNIYNDYDGYSVPYSLDGNNILSIDFLIWGGVVANARLVINLPRCKEEALRGDNKYGPCSDSYSTYANANPAIDYKQNGSRTPISTDGRIIETGSLTNYNCMYDSLLFICNQDEEIGGVPNRTRQSGNFFAELLNIFKTGQDFAILEPADNVATFYYQQLFLEGDQSRNGVLDKESIPQRYYNITTEGIKYLAIPNHWATDLNQPTHVFMSLGNNHGQYETFVEEHYGLRVIGGTTTSQNVENYSSVSAYMTQRRNNFKTIEVGDIQTIFMEQAFLTYHLLSRDGYNKIENPNDSVFANIQSWGINNAIVINSNLIEKGIIDLRKCRNSSSCNNE